MAEPGCLTVAIAHSSILFVEIKHVLNEDFDYGLEDTPGRYRPFHGPKSIPGAPHVGKQDRGFVLAS